MSSEINFTTQSPLYHTCMYSLFSEDESSGSKYLEDIKN